MASPSLTIHNKQPRRIAENREVPRDEPLIFVVEDDASTRRFLCRILRISTNAVLVETSDPQVALRKATETTRPIDLLISDIDLSSTTTGTDLARELVARNSSMKVLLMSGSDRRPRNIPAAWMFLAKPFSIMALLGCVHELCGTVKPARSFDNGFRPETGRHSINDES